MVMHGAVLDIFDDGGLLKTTLRAGDGASAPLHGARTMSGSKSARATSAGSAGRPPTRPGSGAYRSVTPEMAVSS